MGTCILEKSVPWTSVKKKFILPWGSWVVGHANETGHSINFFSRNMAFNLTRRWVGEPCWRGRAASSQGSFSLAPDFQDFLLETKGLGLQICLPKHMSALSPRTRSRYTFFFFFFFLFIFPSLYKVSTENQFELFWKFGFLCFSAILLDYVPDIIAKKLNNTSRDGGNWIMQLCSL